MFMIFKDNNGELKKFGQYSVVKKISKSNFGDLYLVKKKGKDKEYVLKEYSHTRNMNRINTEMKVLKIVSEVNGCVNFHGFKKVAKHFYTLFDYASGGDLDKYIRKNGPLDEKSAIEVLYKVLRTIDHAHRNKIVHLDIKTDNIFIHEGNYHLCDWGVSKIGDSFPVLNINGDDNYVAPEVYIDGKFDHRYDIYSLGCTLYQMLCGEEVYSFTKDTLLVEKIYSHTMLDLNYPYHISLKMKYLISRMVDKDPNTRATIDEIYKIINGEIEPKQIESNYIKINDFENRAKYYELMAQKDFVYAQNLLAIIYEDGKYAEQDFEKALYWYEKSSSRGLAKALNNLGISYLNGDIVEQDLKKAFELFSLASQQGYSKAQYYLSTMYRDGKYVKKDEYKYKQLLKVSAYNGSRRGNKSLQ